MNDIKRDGFVCHLSVTDLAANHFVLYCWRHSFAYVWFELYKTFDQFKIRLLKQKLVKYCDTVHATLSLHVSNQCIHTFSNTKYQHCACPFQKKKQLRAYLSKMCVCVKKSK